MSARFSLTAGENIGAGDPAEFFNRELWVRAAGLTGANAAIESLPLGYDTVLEDNGALAAASGSIDRYMHIAPACCCTHYVAMMMIMIMSV